MLPIKAKKYKLQSLVKANQHTLHVHFDFFQNCFDLKIVQDSKVSISTSCILIHFPHKILFLTVILDLD